MACGHCIEPFGPRTTKGSARRSTLQRDVSEPEVASSASACGAPRLRHRALTLAALLVAATLLVPLASGQDGGGLLGQLLEDVAGGAPEEAPAADPKDENKRKDKEKDRGRDEREEDSSEIAPGAISHPDLRLPSGQSAFPAPRWGLGIASVGLGIMGLAMLGAAVGLGRLATRPRRPRLGVREAGRQRALLDAPLDGEGALRAFEARRFGKLAEAAHVPEAHARVAVLRRRKVSCEEVGGYLSGAFESAWGTDVTVDHPECSGRKRKAPCRFEVRAVRRP